MAAKNSGLLPTTSVSGRELKYIYKVQPRGSCDSEVVPTSTPRESKLRPDCKFMAPFMMRNLSAPHSCHWALYVPEGGQKESKIRAREAAIIRRIAVHLFIQIIDYSKIPSLTTGILTSRDEASIPQDDCETYKLAEAYSDRYGAGHNGGNVAWSLQDG
ncbi:predicted protein [Histoplasma capsulatum var. duboisii H88]|uniref:Predicted protein n=1 Tax=Ajellomyces capsulatus (strain H88) TaxID=544711 RepID=F0UTA5_AJEC8|nr:predicted protein [Histoplasma capsulatum var. duboisii H88]